MARAFKESPRRTGADRRNTERNANRSRRTAPAPTRQRTPIMDRLQNMRSRVGGGGPGGPSRDPRQGAIDFGRSMTGGGGATEQAVNDIRNKVMQTLGGRGIYQDDRGSYQIRGLERNDPSLAIRDMAVRGMGGSPWEQAVAAADARLRQPGGTSGLPGGMNVPNGTSMADSIIQETNRRVAGQPMPPDVFPSTRGGAPQPGSLGSLAAGPQPGLSAPPMRPPVVSNGNIEPGRGPLTPAGTGPPQIDPRLATVVTGAGSQPPPPSNGFPSQGQGVGRTTGVTPPTGPIGLGGSPAPAPAPPTGRVGLAPAPQPGLSSSGVRTTGGQSIAPQPGLSAPAQAYPTPGGGITQAADTSAATPLYPGGPTRVVGASPRLPGSPIPQVPLGSRQNFQGPSAPPLSTASGPVGLGGAPFTNPGVRTTPVSSGADVGMMGSVLGSMEQSRQERALHGLFGGTGQTPADTNAVVTYPVPGADYPGGMSTNQRGLMYQQAPQGGMPGNAPGGGVAPNIYAPPGGFPPQGQGVGRTTTPTGNQVSPTQYPVTNGGPGSLGSLAAGPQPGLSSGGIPPAPGRPTTPVVSPGSLPGQTTPSRPGQMPSVFPTMPGMPGGMKDLSGLGGQISADVANRIAGIRQQAGGVPNPQLTGMASLEGLGGRIQASVMRGISGTSAMPGVGTSDLSGGLGQSIMDRVRSQLTQAGVGQGMPGMPQPTRPQMPGMPQMPGVPTDMGASIRAQVQQQIGTRGMGPMPSMPVPGSPSTVQTLVPPGGAPSTTMPITAPGPGSPAPGQPSIVNPNAPTTTGSFGPGWPGDQMDALNGAYDSAAQETGVPGNVAKAIQTLETGGDVNGYTGQENCDRNGPSDCVALNSGIFRSTAESHGLDYDRIVGDPQYAAYAVSKVLGDIAGWDAGSVGGTPGQTVYEAGGWDGVASVYFSGHLVGSDETGRTSGQYSADFDNYLAQLGGAGGMGTPGTVDPNTGVVVTGAGMGGTTPSTSPSTGTYSVGSVATGAPVPAIDTSYSTQGGAWPKDAQGQPAATSPMAPGQFQPQFIVYHTTEGTGFNGAGTYDQDGDGSPDGSTNYVIEKDGTIHEIVPPGSAMPWANGQTEGLAGVNPQKSIVYQAAGEDNLNNRSISIEMVAVQGERLTPQQIAAGQALTAYLSGQYNIPLDDQHMVGHSDITSGTRSDPGTVYQPMDMVATGPAQPAPQPIYIPGAGAAAPARSAPPPQASSQIAPNPAGNGGGGYPRYTGQYDPVSGRPMVILFAGGTPVPDYSSSPGSKTY